MDIIEARLLAEKFASGNITVSEHEAFFIWFSQLPVAQSRLLLEDYSGIFEALQRLPAEKELWNKIYRQLDLPMRSKAYELPEDQSFTYPEETAFRKVSYTNTRVIRLRLRRRWPVAAAILLALGLASYLLFFLHVKNSSPLTQQQRFRNDIAPGRNAAILTVAGGKQIILDSTAKGTINIQGNTSIVNNKGRLAYRAGSSRPPSSEPLYNTLTIPKGNQYELTLPDRSKVWLNASSSITFPTVFAGNERTVSITGEAYFEITPDPRKPFTVSVRGQDVQVLGTHFNINAYEEEQELTATLLEGKIKVGTALLAPGEQAIVSPQGKTGILKNVDIDRIMAWKNNLFIFYGDDIKSVMRQLGRWYNLEVQYSSTMPERHFSGIISRNNNILQVLKMLESTEKVKFMVEGNKVVVMP